MHAQVIEVEKVVEVVQYVDKEVAFVSYLSLYLSISIYLYLSNYLSIYDYPDLSIYTSVYPYIISMFSEVEENPTSQFNCFARFISFSHFVVIFPNPVPISAFVQ